MMTHEEYRKHFRQGFDDGRREARDARWGKISADSTRRTLRIARTNVMLFESFDVPYSAGLVDGFVVDVLAYGDPFPRRACDAQDHNSEAEHKACLDCNPLEVLR